MSTFMRRRCRLLGVTVLSVAMLAGSAGVSAAAPAGRSGTAGGRSSSSAVEPGWPESHLPEADPRPGEPGYLDVRPTLTPPPDGMTDEEFKARDPEGFAALLPERAQIERRLLERARGALAKEGLRAADGSVAASDIRAAETVLAATTWSPYGYLRFRLVPNTTSPYARNGYLGTLYFIYGIYYPTVDAYKWYTVSWPARSGNNRPADQSKVGVGPIPAYTWDFGFMNGVWRGYEADGRDAFYPGKWRLDPWTGGPYNRCYLEVHGGRYSHEFAATSGCVRVYPSAITALKSYYDTKMANKKDKATADLRVAY